ncbi:hypothetical protein QFZ40_001391 [Arthrobacter pascens]|uniref:hypothetical protein n=1 Tax=Arthrobacter pascens TaxID=1677 RepID=UPI00277DAC69|nr:hypothetical protein [Arthrobacter pascens]MDQ0633482.1 hypothetical protein [Arthrobacter pascens]
MGTRVVCLGAAAIVLTACSPVIPPAPSSAPGTAPYATASATPAPAPSVDATEIAFELKARVPTITAVTTLTEDLDTSRMLGRPGHYLSAAWITDAGAAEGRTGIDAGAVVEVFANAADARERSADIQEVLKKASPVFGTEWHYLKGATLLRVSGKLAPSTNDRYASAFRAISGA